MLPTDKTKVPAIYGAKGKGSREPTVAPNSLFSTDILFTLLSLGEGPVYRINPNGPQDIQIQDSDIIDLINIDTDGSVNPEKFFYVGATGTTSQKPLPYFGDEIITAQSFASPVSLKKGNLAGVPQNKVELQETSENDWDSLRFNFLIDALARGTEEGDVYPYTVVVKIEIFDYIGTTKFVDYDFSVHGKSDTALKQSIQLAIPEDYISSNGYRFSITKISDDVDDSKIFDDIKIIGWDEIKNQKLAYPRTALLGLAIKAVNEHQGAVPNFTSLLKGMIVKVPSNYNQPTLTNSEIDWRHIELPEGGANGYTVNGYYLQDSSDIKYDANPNIYKGVWDGTFVYSWTQNPVWIMYDILTNSVYGLGIPEKNIDKYTFYKTAMYCDACDFSTGNFIGVDGLSDGSFRNKPLGKFVSNVENQLGLPKGLAVKERRFVCDISITDQSKGIDVLNEIAASIRSVLTYSGGKISLASDMPDEYPTMIFNEKNIKKGSIAVSGYKLSDVITSVDASYIEPTNHFKREVVHVDANEINNGSDLAEVENNLSLDLKGVTRRSQAMRTAQYMLASSRYQKRSISFTTGTEAIYLSPGDLISVATTGSGINYGYGGRVSSNSAVDTAGNTYISLEHFTSPAISDSVITGNTYPLALRVTKQDTDKTDLYIVSDTDFATSSVYGDGNDLIQLKALNKYDPVNKTFSSSLTSFTESDAPVEGDLWSFGEIENTLNFYTSKAGRLFKVKEIKRQDNEEVSISAVEYIPEVYQDSDSFINYEPISYTDVVNYLEVPPIPKLSLSPKPRRRSDGSVAIDARMTVSTPTDRFYTDFATEYEVASPEGYTLLQNTTPTEPLTVHFDSSLSIKNGDTVAIEGKNGFSTNVGKIPLLCTAVSTADLGFVTLTLEGLSTLTDENFEVHILEVNDGVFPGVPKGSDAVEIPILEKSTESSLLNFVGYADNKRLVSRVITDYNLTNDTIKIEDTVSGTSKLSQKLPAPPFYVSLSQVLESEQYLNNSFYIEGFKDTYISEGTLSSSDIELPVTPRDKKFTRLYIDGIKRTNYSVDASTVTYTGSGSEYRVEVDHYAPPAIEVGDLIEDDYSRVYTVISNSYDFNHPDYSEALTLNSVYKIQTAESPGEQLTGQRFTNVTANPIGTVSNITDTTASVSYSKSDYPGLLNLSNNRIYSLAVNSDFESFVPESDSLIRDLPLGTTVVRARNRNLFGRTSRFTQKSINIAPIPIQKVENIQIRESLYREQNSGVSTRVTVEFDHILGQEVTDYEVSYKISSAEELGGDTAGITSFNTVKLPASGVDDDGKMRFTINNVDRGATTEANEISVKITPLNKSIRGVTASISQTILGKTAKPQNILNFTGGQQTDQITLFWQYPRVGEQLADIDLKEVIIRRIPGTVAITGDNFVVAAPLVTVSAGTARKSIPIDTFGTFTYLAKTRDTSGNLSDDVVGITITTSRPKKSTTIRAYNEDDPSVNFTDIINNNASESKFPSFNDSTTGGIAYDPTPASYDSVSFDVSSEELLPTALFFKPDGTKMYVCGFGSEINEYNLSSAWDISTASYVQNFSVLGQEASPTGLFFKSDGTKMYIVGLGGDDVNEYALSSAWNISTASYIQNFSIAAQDDTPLGLSFKSDGTKMYVVGSENDSVNEYDLSSAWDISTASYLQSFSVAAEDTAPLDLFFKPDGTKMFITGSDGDDVNEYDLSIAWDISTASYSHNFSVSDETSAPSGIFFKADGNKMYILDQSGPIYQYSLPGVFSIINPDYGSATDNANGTSTGFSAVSGDTTDIAADGSAVYVTQIRDLGTGVVGSIAVDIEATQVIQSTYNDQKEVVVEGVSDPITVGWDLSNAEYSGVSFDTSAQNAIPTGLFFKPDGFKMYILDLNEVDVNEYTLSTAWNISSASYVQNFSVSAEESAPIGLFFKPDGTKMYIVGIEGDDVNQYDLSSAWNISSASYSQNCSVSAQETAPTDLFFKPDGTKMYILGLSGDDVNEYTLSTAWDISSASYSQNFNVASEEVSVRSLFFKPDGLKMYIVGQEGDDVNEYALSSAWDISTASYIQNFDVSAQDTLPTGIFFKPDGTKMYITGTDSDSVYQYSTEDVGGDTTVFIDTDFGGIGHLLGFANTAVPAPRYDANNKTWMTGPANGNVWAIWNPGQFAGDESNANSYALIAGLINATSVKLGEAYYANGDSTSSNVLANLTTNSGSYQLVNLKQFNDLGTQTYQGDIGIVSTLTEVRTATDDVYYANGNVDISKFVGSAVNDGYVPYEAGSKEFRFFQIRHTINNSDVDNYDYIIDKFRYAVDKEQTLTTKTVTYDSSPKTVSYIDRKYLTRPVVSYAILDQIDAESNPAIAVSTAVSNQSLSFKLFASDGSGEYNANSTANVMITIIGV